jgi:hypothetical protein
MGDAVRGTGPTRRTSERPWHALGGECFFDQLTGGSAFVMDSDSSKTASGAETGSFEACHKRGLITK